MKRLTATKEETLRDNEIVAATVIEMANSPIGRFCMIRTTIVVLFEKFVSQMGSKSKISCEKMENVMSYNRTI